MSRLLGGATVCTGIGSDGGKQGCATGAAHAAAFDVASVATASCVALLAFSRVVSSRTPGVLDADMNMFLVWTKKIITIIVIIIITIIIITKDNLIIIIIIIIIIAAGSRN